MAFRDILQPTHLLIVLAIVLIIFGPSKLPEIGSALGRSIREFKSTIHGGEGKEKAVETGTTDKVE